MSRLKIGNIELENQVITAPLAGVSNPAFRKVIKSFNPGLICTEMTSDKALLYHNKKTLKMLEVSEDQQPVSLQLFGNDPGEMAKAAKLVCEHSTAKVLDLNMGCPVPKIVRQGSGCALMKDPEKAGEIVKAVKEVIDRPLTVKIRSGWDQESINAVEVAKALENAGADAITVHPRTRTQYYQGHSDWELIKEVKQAVKIPVIGNGDILTPYDAEKMLKDTGCDGVMIGRGMLGNPWLIAHTVHYLDTGEDLPGESVDERFRVARLQAQALEKEYGEVIGMKMMRSHACWYVHNLSHGNQIKYRLSRIKTYEELDRLLTNYQRSLLSGDFTWINEDN